MIVIIVIITVRFQFIFLLFTDEAMNKILTIATLSAALLSSGAVWATDSRPAHFKGVESADLTAAMANLAEYNQRFAVLLEQKTLTQEDLAAVHQLTYTLENALERISKDLGDVAETLERVHVASETMQPETVQTEGARYLKMANVLTGTNR